MTTRKAKTTPRRGRKTAVAASPSPAATKLDQLTALLARPDGANIAEMTAATGWQAHSVRGAMAGSLKRRGLSITSEKVDGVRRYRSGTGQ